MYSLLLPCLALVLFYTTAGWLMSLLSRRVSIIDAFWGPGFAAIVVFCFLRSVLNDELAASFWSTPGRSARTTLMLMTVVWGLRLGVYLGIRVSREQHEDRRYAAMRTRHDPGFWLKSLWIVFWLQGGIMWIVALPLQTAFGEAQSSPKIVLCGIAAMIWLVGFAFEAIGDWQLAAFKRDPANQGRVLNRGLWKYTRHPNYFGDFMVWWGLWLFAVGIGAPVWTVVSPLIMSVFLMKFSGVGLLEKDIADRRPEYVEYRRTTNTFFPGIPGSHP